MKENPSYLGVMVGLSSSAGAFDISLEFKQLVIFAADKTTYCQYGTTWQAGSYGRYSKSEFIISALDRQLDTFLNDYQKVNGNHNK